MNLLEQFMLLWNSNKQDSTIVFAGTKLVNGFKPNTIDTSDEAKILTIAFAVVSAMQNEIDGDLPQACMEAVLQGLTGVYGIGIRRGAGDALHLFGNKAIKASHNFVTRETHETVPEATHVHV